MSNYQLCDGSLGGELVECLQSIVLSDRYNKNDQALDGLEFTLVRDLLNTYNQKHCSNFLDRNAN